MGNFHKQKLTLLGTIFLAACGGGGGGGGGGTSDGGGYGTTPSNTAPTIDNSTNDYSTIEGTTNGFMVNASDADGNSLTYSISGNDGSKMSVSSSGVVSFINAPDYENPEDENGDNVYSFNVSVSDGNLSIAEGFTITVTNDTSDDNADTFAAWDGVLLKDDTYKPYDKHATSYNLIIGGLPDVTDGFVTNVANIANKMLVKNDATNSVNRNLLLNNFNQYKSFQRVGSTNLSSYDPALNNDNYDGWDNINDNYSVVDFIWESTYSSPADERTKANQINAILEHLLHTITLIFDKSYTSWGYEDESSALVLAMNEAITGGFYDPSDNYGSLSDSDPALYKRIIAQEFAYWMILTGWDLKALYAPDASPEWTISNASEMETKLPLAHTLFKDTVNGVLVNPTQAYLDSLSFSSLVSATDVANGPSFLVSIEANANGAGNVYVIDGTQKKSIALEVGVNYIFNHSTDHPLRFSTTPDGTHGGGVEYAQGVYTYNPGRTEIEVHSETPTTLYYYCSIHPGMGGSITISD
ncbi:MAG: hypothetical protein ACPG6D_00780 [Gammaproteobacteria bacterium]